MQPLLELREFDGVAAILVELVENVLDIVPLEFLVDFLEQDSKLVHTQAFVSGVVQFFEQFVEVEVIGNNSLAQVIYNVFGLVFQLRIVVDKRLEVPFEQGISINVIPRRPNFFLRVQTSSQEVLRFFWKLYVVWKDKRLGFYISEQLLRGWAGPWSFLADTLVKYKS